MLEKIECGTPYFMTMGVDFTGVVDETARGLTTANQNTDVTIFDGLTDLKQASAQFSLQSGRFPSLWSTESMPILAMLGFIDNDRPSEARWPKEFYLRSNRRIEGNFLNTGAEAAGKVVFLSEKVEQPLAVEVDTALGDDVVIGIDSKFTAAMTGGEEPDREFSAPRDYPFLLMGFYADLQRADLKITGVDSREWMTDWTPVWSLAQRQDSPVRRLRRPYLIQPQQTLGVNFKNHATLPEASGKLWLIGRRLG